TKLNAWQGFGEYFQLGYVVGYLDAVKLINSKDRRVMVPTSGSNDYDRWLALVNEYFVDPKNADRSVPDAMFAAGQVITAEKVQNLHNRPQSPPTPPAPSPPAASPSP